MAIHDVIEKAVSTARKRLGIDNLYAPDLEKALEQLKKVAKKFDFNSNEWFELQCKI
jgi:hypothetical protein